MADGFDPYHKWLGIPPEEQPPDLYRLLSIKPLESDPDVIESAADRQMAHLRTYQAGQHGQLSQQLLNEVSAARVTLLNTEKKAEYDACLREQLEAEAAADEALPVAEPLSTLESSMPEILTEAAPAVSVARPAKSKKPLSGRTIVWAVAGGVAALGVLVLILSSGGERSSDLNTAQNPSPSHHPAPEAPRSRPPQPPPSAPPVHPPVTPSQDEPVAKPPPVEQTPEKPEPVELVATPERKPPVTPEPEPEPKPEPEPVGKPAVPSGESRKAVAGQLEEVYEISKLKKPSEKVELAKKLIELGQKSNDPAEQFVLLRTAMELSSAGGDAKLMLEAVDQIAERFAIEPLKVKAKVLSGFAAKATNSARIGSFIESTDAVIDQAMADEQFDMAADLADRAYRLGQRSSGRKWRKQTHTRRVEVRKLQQSWQKSQAMLAKLKEQPDDPEANLAVGLWYCFERGEWQQGLPHLAKSSDAQLKALAKEELESPPAKSTAQLKLADAWWKLAQSHKGDDRTALMLRAGTWYTESLPNVTSTLMRTKVERRLAELGKLGKKIQDLSAQAADATKGFKPGRWVDILSPVDTANGVVRGQWKMTRQGLVGGPSEASQIMLPVAIKGDYNLKVDLTRLAGDKHIVITFPIGSNAASLYLADRGGTRNSLQRADKHQFSDDTTFVQTGPMTNGRPHSVAISVRNEGENVQIGATLNNRPLLRWSGKASSLGSWNMPTKNQPGLGSLLDGRLPRCPAAAGVGRGQVGEELSKIPFSEGDQTT